MGFFNTIAEGGQTWTHRMRMLKQVLKTGLFCAFLCSLGYMGIAASKHPVTRYQALYYQNRPLATEKTVPVNKEFWAKVANQRHFGSEDRIQVPVKHLKRVCDREINLLTQDIKQSGFKALILAAEVFGIFMVFFLLRGLRSKRKQHLSGTKCVSPWILAMTLRMRRRNSFLKIGSVPCVKNTETQHFLISGGTGSGKTRLIHTLLPQIRAQQQRTVIVDTTGEYISKYYNPETDHILNPFDDRSKDWSPWAECKDSYDYDTLAESFIPQSHCEKENYWRLSAKSVFSSLLELHADDPLIESLAKSLLTDPLDVFANSLQYTKAAAHMSVEKTSGNIRSFAVSSLECLNILKNTIEPFSIKDWVRDGSGWLFLSSSTNRRTLMRPLISAWFSIAMQGLLQLDPDFNRRLWFVADELPTLNKLKDLETCLTEGRKYGACALLAIQSPAQLEKIYGREGSQIIMGNCNTKVAFTEQDPQVAQKISKVFGEKEIKEYQEGISYGANTVRDGVNLSPSSKIKPVVSASEIQSLEKQEAYVKLPGRLPVTRVKLKFSA